MLINNQQSPNYLRMAVESYKNVFERLLTKTYNRYKHIVTLYSF